MPGWINKFFGGTTGAPASVRSTAADVSAGWGSQLFELLKPLDQQTRPGTARDLARFVLTGEPVSALGRVAGSGFDRKLPVTGYGANEALNIYRGFDSLPVATRLRWAEFLEAASAAGEIYSLNLPGGAHWPEILLMHASGSGSHFGTYRNVRPFDFSAGCLEEMLVATGMDPSAVIVSSFASPIESSYFAGVRQKLVADLPGYSEALGRYSEAIRPLLLAPGVPQRLHVLELLERAGEPALPAFASELAALATSSSKQVRKSAMSLVYKAGNSVDAPLKEVALEGKPDERAHALRLLFDLGQSRPETTLSTFARKAAAADPAASVRTLAEQWSEAVAPAAGGGLEGRYTVPEIDWSVQLTPSVKAAVESLWNQVTSSIKAMNEYQRQQAKISGRGSSPNLAAVPSDADLKSLIRYLETGRPGESKGLATASGLHYAGASLVGMAANPEVTPVMLFKLMDFLGLAAEDRQMGGPSQVAAMAFNEMHKRTGRPALLELSEMYRAAGVSPEVVMLGYCNRYRPLANDWEAEAVWPFFANHLEVATRTMTHGTDEYWFDRTGPLKAIATLPEVPQALVGPLFDMALGSSKTDRPGAQEALTRVPGYEKRVIAALGDAKAAVRIVASEWLGRLNHEPAVAALEKALAKEKNDLAKGSMLDALQALGQPVDKYLNLAGLADEAAKALAKPAPKELDWFPWSSIPQVHWADSGKPVEPVILKWMLVQAVRQKSPEPNAILRKYCSMFEPRGREGFGQFVLESWLHEDTRPIDPEEARRQAVAEAQQMHRAISQYSQYYALTQHVGKTVEQITESILPRWLSTAAGSAIGSKGLLAVAAACAAERAAPAVWSYLKEYYGTRAAQGKALIGMLAWVDHPSATQLMLSVGSRFRTKSFQEEAVRQAEALAERNNWTLAELSDRTVDSAGFDEAGEMELDYGGRMFTARLMADLTVTLFNEEGKKIASLPEPRQTDDAELAKAAKKTLPAVRKQIKSTVEQQTDRLYEALCTEREWSFDDWDLYLNRHPVVRRLVQRLVWVEMDGDKAGRVFRPLEDGSLTDSSDDAVEVAPEAMVRLAHDWLLDDAEVARWQQHLADYEVKPLFQQLGKGRYLLPAGKADEVKVTDFEGHLIESFTLRGRATRLGYTRGAPGDGGWFHTYVKRFPTLGLEAMIEFTGSGLPEESRTVALISLSFADDRGGQYWQRPALPLSGIPKILLSECYSDLRLIAGEGKGFDPDWRKKTEY